jgi:branched-chain amino acid transport system permease protein
MVNLSWGFAAQLLVYGIFLGTTYAAMAMSFGLIYSTTRTFHLAHSITFALSAYVMVKVAEAGVPYYAAALVGIAAGAVFGVVVDYVIYSPLRVRRATIVGIFLAALGIVVAGQAGLQIIFGAVPQSIPGVPLRSLQWGPVAVSNMNLISFGVLAVSMGMVWLFVNKSRMGHAITAVRTNVDLASSSGIPVKRVMAIVFAIGSAMAAEVAFFEAGVYQANPTMGLTPVLFGFIGVFLGGVGSLAGSALGGFILGFVIVMSGLVASQGLGVIIAFLVLIIVLIFKPEGLLAGSST